MEEMETVGGVGDSAFAAEPVEQEAAGAAVGMSAMVMSAPGAAEPAIAAAVAAVRASTPEERVPRVLDLIEAELANARGDHLTGP